MLANFMRFIVAANAEKLECSLHYNSNGLKISSGHQGIHRIS